MPLRNIKQPEIIEIDSSLRLRAYDGNYKIAVPWYQDDTVRFFSEGVTDETEILDENYVKRKLYRLNTIGEAYFIEVLKNGQFVPIGDVTLKEVNPPIEIGIPEYRGIGIGKKVMQALVNRAKNIGMKKIYDTGCHEENYACQKMLEAVGFVLVEHNHDENRKIYEIELMK
jgi:RimJ/RimL family protein N-acetyltransferase